MNFNQKFPEKSKPDITFFYTDYSCLSEADKWFCLAKVYLNSANLLLQAIANRTLDSATFLPVDFLLTQSLELFLKGAIAQASKRPIAGHKIDKLYAYFLEIYPEDDCKFTWSIQKMLKQQIVHNEFGRYPVDSKGKTWPLSNYHYSSMIWLKGIQVLKDDYERIEPLLKQKYPNKSKV